jgi:hypothetical protein
MADKTPIDDQPPPIPTNLRGAWDIVIAHVRDRRNNDDHEPETRDHVLADMADRDRIGRERYGTPLTAHNGRNSLIDAYQEALDLVVYLACYLDEHDLAPGGFTTNERHGALRAELRCVQGQFYEALRIVFNLRMLIDDQAGRCSANGGAPA